MEPHHHHHYYLLREKKTHAQQSYCVGTMNEESERVNENKKKVFFCHEFDVICFQYLRIYCTCLKEFCHWLLFCNVLLINLAKIDINTTKHNNHHHHLKQ